MKSPYLTASGSSQPTYEELKHRTESCLPGEGKRSQPTYEVKPEIQGLNLFNRQVLSLPMRIETSGRADPHPIPPGFSAYL